MKTYGYRGYDRTGAVRKGLMEAMDLKDARERLAREGILAERIASSERRVHLSADARAAIYRELGALLGAGLPLVRALDTLIESPEMGEAGTLLAGVRDRVKEGASLADAMAKAGRSVSTFERALIEAAERSATVDRMLERLAAFIEEQDRIKDRVQSALIYPVILLSTGICIGVVMLGLFLPFAKEILDGTGAPLPLLTRLMMGFGRWLMRWGLLVLAAAGGAAFMVKKRLAVDPSFGRWLNEKSFDLPLVGRGYAMLVNLRFARTMSILLHGGVSVLEGLPLAGRATGSSWVAHLANGEAEAVRHGASLSDAVRRIPPLAASLPAWIRIGEAGGDLERMLENAGDRYQVRWDRLVSRGLSLLEPLLILVIGVFVLLVTLSVLLPILNLSSGLT